MKEHSHNQIVYEMLTTHPYVFIKDLRNWCNYRSRISDIRPRLLEEGLELKAVLIDGQHAYKIVPIVKQEPAIINKSQQLEFNLARA